MNVLLFGATGMVGQGALIECLDDPAVKRVVALVRRPTGRVHAKLTEVAHQNFGDYSTIEGQLTGIDACLYCLGVSSAGMNETEYRRITYDYAMAAARTLLRLNPGMTFVYVSGQGTDGSETGRLMWARVKGKVENDLAKLGFAGVYNFRPGVIQPMKGVVSSTPAYRTMYRLTGALMPALRAMAPNQVTTSEVLGRAMIRAARERGPTRVIGIAEINQLGR